MHTNETTATETAAHEFPTPAYEGCAITPANLVLEGGAMRGQFTAGVLDFFMDQKLFCERVIGTSAGALCGYNYVSGQPGRTCRVNTTYANDWRYLSMKSFARTGNAFGREFSFDEIPNKLDPFDYEAFNHSPMKLVSVASDLDTGEADYHKFTDARADIPYLMATSALPLVSQIVEVDGKRLLDGGSCDSVPILYSLLTGVKKHIVVLTQDATYKKKPYKMLSLMRQRYADAPLFVDRVQHRHFEYNRAYRALAHMHDEGEIFLIRPPEPVTVSSMEKDADKLFALYEQGLEEAARVWNDLQAYLER